MISPSFHLFCLHCGRLPSKHVLLLLLSSWVVLVHASSTDQPISIYKTIKEELLPGTIIASLTAEPNFTRSVPTSFSNTSLSFVSPGNQLQYTILNPQRSPGFYFVVTKDGGVVSIKRSIDRESVCSFKIDCVLNFEVAVMSTLSTFFTKVDFMITITDINDNPPEFTQPRFELNMPENVEMGKSYSLPTAFDRDTGPGNGVSEYVILQGEPFFDIKTTKTFLNTTDLFLVLASSVNRELSPNYEILVGAKDGGLPSLTGTLTVEVHVSDINDNFPIFKQDPYTIKIAEDTKLDVPIFQVEATDADTGPNGQLAYSFSPLQPPDNLAYFRIDQATGKIYLTKSIESRSGEEINLIVEASDKGSPPKVTKATVQMSVEDTVNSMPEITVNSLGLIKGISEVSEFAAVGKVVAHVSVRDTDSGDNGKTQCSITPSEFELLPLQIEGTYKVVLRIFLDRELVDLYNVTVTCSDQGFPSLTAQEGFMVKVLDENDQAPIFSQRIYKASITENNQPGAFITQLRVTDKDVGLNAEVVFQVVGKNDKWFSVDDSGKMSTSVSLDREESEKIIVIVRVMDKGVPPLSSSATVEITMLDVNDEAPEFSDQIYLMDVEEEHPPDKYVGIVSAGDKDLGENSTIVYRFSPMMPWNDIFTITSVGGIIKTAVILNRENNDLYNLIIEAVDRGSPPLTGTATVIVRVTDVNDNEPYFIYPTDDNNSVLIPHTTSVRSTVVTVLARDADDGINGKIIYSLNSINKSSPFSIDQKSGAVYLNDMLQSKDIGLYIMTIMASDQALQQQRGIQTLFSIEIYFDNSTLIAATGQAGPTEEIITAIIVIIVIFVVCVIVIFTVVYIRRKKLKRKNAMSNSASTSSTAKLQGGYYVTPGIRSSSSSVITKPEERNLLPGDGMRTTNPYVVLIKDEPSGPAEFVKISRNGPAHALNDTLPADLDQTDDGQFSTFKSQENILSPGVKYGSLSRKVNDNSSMMKRMNDTYDDISCDDDSTSDSGRGGSDLEVNKEKARAQAATPVSVKSGISHRLSPLPQEQGKTFVTFRGESPNSYKFDSDSDTLTRNNIRSRLTPIALPTMPVRDSEGNFFNQYRETDSDGSLTRSHSLFPPQPYSAGLSSGSRHPQRITPLTLYSPPTTCHQYDTETDQSDGGSNSNSLSRRNHIPRLPLYHGIEFTHHAYGSTNRNSLGGAYNGSAQPSPGEGYETDYGRTRWFDGGPFNISPRSNGTSFNYPNLYPSDYANQSPLVANGYNNVVSELQISRPVSMEEDFLLPPYPEGNEDVGDDNVDDIIVLPGYSALTPNKTEEQTALFKSRFESSA